MPGDEGNHDPGDDDGDDGALQAPGATGWVDHGFFWPSKGSAAIHAAKGSIYAPSGADMLSKRRAGGNTPALPRSHDGVIEPQKGRGCTRSLTRHHYHNALEGGKGWAWWTGHDF